MCMMEAVMDSIVAEAGIAVMAMATVMVRETVMVIMVDNSISTIQKFYRLHNRAIGLGCL